VKKLLLIISLTLLTKFVFAQGSSIGLQLPGMGQSFGQDSIRAGELHCQNAIGGGTNLEFGVTGVIDNYQSPLGNNLNRNTDPSNRNIGVYARIIVPLDGPKERINCNSLYELELRKKRLEVLRLQEEIDTLKRLNSNGGGPKFEN
jgi:hypothetical protein